MTSVVDFMCSLHEFQGMHHGTLAGGLYAVRAAHSTWRRPLIIDAFRLADIGAPSTLLVRCIMRESVDSICL